MNAPIRKITNICRLCLTEELDILIPTKDAIESSLTPEDVERFTGVQIPNDDDVPYVICTDCAHSLRKSVAFRNMCVGNDRLYRQLFSEFILEIKHQTDRHKESVVADRDSGYDDNVKRSSEIETVILTSEDSDSNLSTIEQDKIASGTDSETPSYEVTTRKKNKRPRRKTEIRRKGREKKRFRDYKKSMCEICGQFVITLSRHMKTHSNHRKYACPYCPVKMSVNCNLLHHIKVVHLKTKIYTCDACGMGFTYYNTYHTHMANKHGIGKLKSKLWNKCPKCPKWFKTLQARKLHELSHTIVFSCKHCPKSFPYRSQLTDHMKQVHSEYVTDKEQTNSV